MQLAASCPLTNEGEEQGGTQLDACRQLLLWYPEHEDGHHRYRQNWIVGVQLAGPVGAPDFVAEHSHLHRVVQQASSGCVEGREGGNIRGVGRNHHAALRREAV